MRQLIDQMLVHAFLHLEIGVAQNVFSRHPVGRFYRKVTCLKQQRDKCQIFNIKALKSRIADFDVLYLINPLLFHLLDQKPWATC